MLAGLVKLIRYMDGLCRRAEPEEIRRLMCEADVSRQDILNACKFHDLSYARNLMARSHWYELVVICWRFDQGSPIHDHEGSVCGVRIIDGLATETIYRENPKDGLVRPIASLTHERGEVCMSVDRDIHVIRNLERNRDLITLHLYSPPLRMNYYQSTHEFSS